MDAVADLAWCLPSGPRDVSKHEKEKTPLDISLSDRFRAFSLFRAARKVLSSESNMPLEKDPGDDLLTVCQTEQRD